MKGYVCELLCVFAKTLGSFQSLKFQKGKYFLQEMFFVTLYKVKFFIIIELVNLFDPE